MRVWKMLGNSSPYLQNGVIELDEVVDATAKVEQQPNHNDRSKRSSKLSCAKGLNGEQKYKNCTRDTNDRC